MTTAFGGILRSLANREVITPYLENAILSQEWPDSYNIRIDSSPYYGHGDGYFHPSTHPLMGERQLFYLFHPDYRDAIVRERPTLKRELTLSMGSALHGIVQTQFIMSGLVKPENIEALAVDTLIPTPDGFVRMEDIKEGDYVFSPDGAPTKVMKAHEVHRGRPCYRVDFQSGASIVADADHLWEINIGDGDKTKVVTTAELALRRHSSVTVAAAVDWGEQELPVDPWLLGYWLGDGATIAPTLAVCAEDVEYVEGRLSNLGLSYIKGRAGARPGHNYAIYVKGIRLTMSALGLLHQDKFIPDCYMRGSVDQRMELLRGFMDSDGSAGRQVAFSQASEKIARQVFSLARSLGINARISKRYPRAGKGIFVVRWNAASGGGAPFGMPRKVSAWEAGRSQYRGRKSVDRDPVKTVEPVQSVPVRCLTVDNDSHLFLAGEGFVPTHNCEYINADHHVRGRIDFIVDHPDGRTIPVEMKALACSTPILTTSGWSTMGELRDGDEVYAPDGQPTKVLRAHPIRLGRPCYEVKFRDGQSVVADEDHLWAVHDRNNGGRDRVMTTGEIAAAAWSDRYRFRVPVTDPLQTPEADLPIDPYLLGVWLGDGSSCQPEITVGDDDLSHLCHRLDALGMSYRVYKYADKAPRVYLHGIRSLFIASGLMGKGGNKYIPEQYLLASESQRRELLAGLMDSDGTVGHHQAAICMTKELLMRQVLQLVRSLGYRATWNESLARVNGKDCPVYWVKFSTSWGPSPFAMPRKKIAWEAKPKKSPQNLRLNAIVSVTEVDTVPTRCITVAHESSLYVVGRGFIPTHNTQSSFGFSKQTEIKPEWDAQLSLALDATGYDTGILLLVEAGFPYGIKEFTVPRNDALLSEIYAKFARVREAIALDQIPNYCCPKGSTVMQNCNARFACWLKDDEEEAAQLH